MFGSRKNKKIKSNKKGFTLAEMMATVLIMSLVVAASVTGIVAISSSYRNVLAQATAEELSEAITSSLNSELSYAKYPKERDLDGDGTADVLEFYSASYRTCYYYVNNGHLMIHSDYYNSDPTHPGQMVIPEKTYANGVLVKDFMVEVDSGLYKVTLKLGTDVNDSMINTTIKVKPLND